MSATYEIVAIGEILWDLLPTGRLLGGAPGNFAFHCHQLGRSAVLLSRVGVDALGREVRQAVRTLGLSDDYLQDDPTHPTGTVSVALGPGGQPTFTIHEGVAWDHLAPDPRLEAVVRAARVVCFGTLMQRNAVSRATVQALLRSVTSATVVCDINLRQHYYSRELIETSLAASDWIKLNDGELIILRDLLGLAGADERSLVADLRRRYDAELVALTRGARGCLVQTADEEVDLPGIPVTVVDTIGAGDAFTAGLVVAHLEGKPVAEAAAFANRLAARVAAAAGGTPSIARREIEG
ncbi:MAG: carbohydrate kinase [Gemmataceae bacterium]